MYGLVSSRSCTPCGAEQSHQCNVVELSYRALLSFCHHIYYNRWVKALWSPVFVQPFLRFHSISPQQLDNVIQPIYTYALQCTVLPGGNALFGRATDARLVNNPISPDVHLTYSPVHEALHLLASRILRPLWHRAIAAPISKKVLISIYWCAPRTVIFRIYKRRISHHITSFGMPYLIFCRIVKLLQARHQRYHYITWHVASPSFKAALDVL